MGDEVVLRNSLWKMLFFLLICTFVVLVALLGPESFGLRPKPSWELIRWPAALLFSAAGILFGRYVFDREPEIVIGHRGIFMRRWSDATIPWDAIKRIHVDKHYVSGLVFQRQICIYLHDPQAYPRTKWRSRFFGRGWNLGYGHITMMTTGLDQATEDIWSAIEQYAPAAVELDGSKLGGPWRGAGTPPKKGD